MKVFIAIILVIFAVQYSTCNHADHKSIKKDNSMAMDENVDEVEASDGDPKSQKDEIMDTAENMVFRPLFVYRQQVARQRRIKDRRRHVPIEETRTNSDERMDHGAKANQHYYHGSDYNEGRHYGYPY